MPNNYKKKSYILYQIAKKNPACNTELTLFKQLLERYPLLLLVETKESMLIQKIDTLAHNESLDESIGIYCKNIWENEVKAFFNKTIK